MRFDADRMLLETRLKDSGVNVAVKRTQHGSALVTLSADPQAVITVSESDIAKISDMIQVLHNAALKLGAA